MDGFFRANDMPPDSPMLPSERLYPQVQNWVAPKTEPLGIATDDLAIKTYEIAQQRAPTPRQAMINLIGRLDQVFKMSTDEFDRYVAEARNVIRPEEFGEFATAIKGIREGKSYALYIDKLNDHYVQVNDLEELGSLVADQIPIIGSLKAGKELYDKFWPLLDLHGKKDRSIDERNEYDKRLEEFIIEAGFLAAPGAKKLGKAALNTPIGQAVKEKVLKHLDEYVRGLAVPGRRDPTTLGIVSQKYGLTTKDVQNRFERLSSSNPDAKWIHAREKNKDYSDSGTRINWDDQSIGSKKVYTTGVPLGFQDPTSFRNAMNEFKLVIGKDEQIGIRGSSVTGFQFNKTPEMKGLNDSRAFNKDSDYDIFVVSKNANREMIEKISKDKTLAEKYGIKFESNEISPPLSAKQLDALGYTRLADVLSQFNAKSGQAESSIRFYFKEGLLPDFGTYLMVK